LSAREERAVENPNYKGLEFIGGFSMLAGVLWVVGAVLVGILVMVGQGRVDAPAPAASQPPAAEAPATQ
jgi:hypothetical protein